MADDFWYWKRFARNLAPLKGCFTTCGQLWTSRTRSRSFMQSLQFCVPVAGILSPLVIAPFLSSDAPQDIPNNETRTLALNRTSLSYSPFNKGHSTKYPSSEMSLSEGDYMVIEFGKHFNQTTNTTDSRSGESTLDQQLFIPFCISGTSFLVTTLLFLLMFCQKTKLNIIEKYSKTFESNAEKQKQTLSFFVRIMRLYLIGQFVFLLKGAENSFVQFFPAFLHNRMEWTKILSSDIMSVFFAAVALGRLIGVLVSYYVKSTSYLFFDLTLLIFSLLVLLLGMYIRLDLLMWVSTAMIGLSFSTIGPCLLNWSQNKVLSRSGKHTSFLLVSLSLGSIVLPLVIGAVVVLDYKWFVYVILTVSVLVLVNHISLFIFVRQKLTPKSESEDNCITVTDKENTKMMK